MRAYEYLRPVMRLWYAKQLADRVHAASPRDEPVSTSGDPLADRVLLLGNGPVHGWGVLTHELALTGRLAAALGTRTGRAADVETVGAEVMNAATAVSWLGNRDLAAYDVVAVVLGGSDAVRLTPVEEWRTSVEGLLATLTSRTRPGVPVVLTMLPWVRQVPRWDGALGSIAQRHADRLNAVLRSVVEAHPQVHLHVQAPLEFTATRPLGSVETYTALAADLAVPVASLLRAVHIPLARPTAPPPEWSWVGTARTLELARSGALPALTRLEDEARETFGVDLALVTLLDGDRQLFPTGGGSVPMSVPRELTYCDVVTETDAPLVVPNRMRDERFRDNPYLDVTHTPFYAGQPLHGADGEVIGTFCLLGSSPKSASAVSIAALKGFALKAETELQRIADAMPLHDEEQLAST